MTSMTTLNVAVIGAGSRGRAYSRYALQHPDKMQVVAVADPHELRRTVFAQRYGIDDRYVYSDWKHLLNAEKIADAVIITTSDRDHVAPTIACAEAGYHILLEKPMATTLQDCQTIVTAVQASNILFAVCHVLLYSPVTKRLEQLLRNGSIGDIVSIQRLEPIGYWHYAHSYVRGNWRREDLTCPILLAKSSHDIDWIRYMMPDDVAAVSSFGSLRHFTAENKPPMAGKRCLHCPIEPNCPYSALKIYLGMYRGGERGWPLDTITDIVNEHEVYTALKNSPYGRCVYECDNSVLDNQVVNMQFTGGQTATFTMVAFSEVTHRVTKLFGTKGQLETDGTHVRLYDFLTGQWRIERIETGGATVRDGHGGGDFGLLDDFIEAYTRDDPRYIRSGAHESLLSHRIVFAAEQARLEKSVVFLEKNADRGVLPLTKSHPVKRMSV